MSVFECDACGHAGIHTQVLSARPRRRTDIPAELAAWKHGEPYQLVEPDPPLAPL